MKSGVSNFKLCSHYGKENRMDVYPSWVYKDLSDSQEDSESDSEFQNLFKMIQRNEYTTTSDPVKEDADENTDIEGFSHEKSEKVGGGKFVKIDAPMKARKQLARPTLFMKPLGGQSAAEGSKAASHRHARFSVGAIGKDGGITAMKLLIMQKGLSETIEPEYRKKDRVTLSIRTSDFNSCHKCKVKKIADRVKNVLHRNYCWINDRDAAESLEVKIAKIFESRISNEKKKLQDRWKLKEPFPDLYQISDKSKKVSKAVPLANQLNFDMPHRKFENDINKYVKRLRELADQFQRKTSSSGNKKEDSYEIINSESIHNEESVLEYRLIPTFETFNKCDENETLSYSGNVIEVTDSPNKSSFKKTYLTSASSSIGFGIDNLKMRHSQISDIIESSTGNLSMSSMYKLKT